MIDVKILRSNPELVQAMLEARGSALSLDRFTELDVRRRELITETDSLKNEKKNVSKEIGQIIRNGGNADEIKARVSAVNERITLLETELSQVEEAFNALVAWVPNLLHADTPYGKSEHDNVEVERWGTPAQFDFEVRDHVDLGTGLGILDFETAVKVTGTRFCVLRGEGAQLERALIQFMIDVHEEQGYFEILPPFMVNSESMFGTGQFPKMKEDVFHLADSDYYLIPTAEVPVTNLHRGEILNEDQLPIYYQAFTPCFRSEAGSYGRDTRGLIRQHQFNKVEMVKFVKPETSAAELEKLRKDAEEILRRLELPYRVMSLCSGDISFAAARCYDLEVWLPAQNTYREISSCSNFTDFQARRARIRYKGALEKDFVHTLNGSGLAVGRTLVAILENYQQADGRILIPQALRPYMKGKTHLGKQSR